MVQLQGMKIQLDEGSIRIAFIFTLVTILLVASIFLFSAKKVYTYVSEQSFDPPSAHDDDIDTEVVENKQAYEDLRPTLLPVCSCESSYEGNATSIPQQFEQDGITVRTGRINSDDIGMCQINTYYHLEDSQKMGIDIYTAEGNVEYANHLYDTQGVTPWNWSSHCWWSEV